MICTVTANVSPVIDEIVVRYAVDINNPSCKHRVHAIYFLS